MSEPSPDQIVVDYLGALKTKVTLSDVETNVWLVYTMELEICNGGFHQFFFNPSGDKWEETLRALKNINARKIAVMFEAALAIFPIQKPSNDQRERATQLKAAGQAAEAKLEELDTEYYSLHELFPDEDSYTLLARYIASQQSHCN